MLEAPFNCAEYLELDSEMPQQLEDFNAKHVSSFALRMEARDMYAVTNVLYSELLLEHLMIY
jgi:hypothetical protein